MHPTKKTDDYKNFLQMAKTGHYPLFFNQWLTESLGEEYHMPITQASTNVQNVFTKLSKHRTIEKKKTALIGMDKMTRDQFVRSFLTMVEHENLKDIKTLH